MSTPATDVVVTNRPAHPANPFAREHLPTHVNAGAVTIESDRAVAEAQGKLIIAKRFPRDEARAFQKIMEACSRPQLANVAMYAYPRGGQQITGPSIRLAEELARCWGNMSYGSRELSRREGVSEMEAFAWDEETNVRTVQQFTVKHIRDKQGGGVPLKDERDIYELTANQAGRRMRARILAIMPPDLVESAVEQCRKTIAGKSDEPLADRVRKMVTKFAKFGVTADHVERRIGHALTEVTPDDIVDLTAIYTSIKDGAKVSDWFNSTPPVDPNAPPPERPRALDAVAKKAAKDKPPVNEGNPPPDAGEDPDGSGL